MIVVKWPTIEAANRLANEQATIELIESLKLEHDKLTDCGGDVLVLGAIKTMLNYYGVAV